jgi:diguanylate cyclase (GGDEF)-like protein/PAS domain S-box-containing protein
MHVSYVRIGLLALGYFVAAGLTIAFTRFGGGFATLWLATSYLTAVLAVRRRTQWLPICIACGFASALATGLLGLGWTVAAPLALVNIFEASLAAHLIRRRIASTTLDSLNWFGNFVLRVGLIAPAVGATLGSLVGLAANDAGYAAAWFTWFVGHALGGLTFTPIALLVARGEISRWRRSLDDGRWPEAGMLFALFLAATVFTFAQLSWPLLFFPLGPLALICFRQDRMLAALSVACLGVIGGAFTALGRGPVALASGDIVSSLQFFQFYLASVVMTILPVTADLRSRKKLVRALRESDDRFRVLLENSTDVLLHLRPEGQILYASPSVEHLSGRSVASLLGGNALGLVDPEWHDHVRRCHAEVLTAKGETVRYEYMAAVGDGTMRWFETISRAIRDEAGIPESVISVVRDIDARKVDELNLVLEASCDPLTGLANRRAFLRAFEAAYGTTALSLAVVDIDHFKSINDRFGHACGDCALQTFAEVARRVVRKDDLVARIGGEEFAILFKGMAAGESWKVCERLRLELANAVTFYGAQSVRFTISAGVTDILSPDPQYSLDRADEALYRAKREGRDRLKLAA